MVYKHFHTQKNKQLLNDNFEKRIWAQNSTSIGIAKVSAGTGTWGKGGKSQHSTRGREGLKLRLSRRRTWE